MKKIISILLTAVIFSLSFLCVGASAEEVTKTEALLNDIATTKSIKIDFEDDAFENDIINIKNVEVSAKFSGGKAESFELVSAEDKCIKVEIKDAATVSCGGKEYKAVDGLFELCVNAGEKLECTVMY
jgi:hypothetical protein